MTEDEFAEDFPNLHAAIQRARAEHDQLRRRAETAEAAIARAHHLADDWANDGSTPGSIAILFPEEAAADLRRTLAGDA